MITYRIYSDFDGTIAVNDVGDALFSTFGGDNWYEPIKKWEQGLISSKECLTLACQSLRITKSQLEEFSDTQTLDPGFNEFVAFCDRHNFPISVVSDGFDFYIRRILTNYALDHIPVLSNHLDFVGPDRVAPQFPYFGKGCPNCANCKGYHLSVNHHPASQVIFIGDGLSDRCAVEHADILFAKDALKTYCLDNNISFYNYNTFYDVKNALMNRAV